jgi:hypothetical protein
MRNRTLAILLLLGGIAVFAQTKKPRDLKPGFNLFSKEQDVAMGQEYAGQVRQQLPVIKHKELGDYLNMLGKKLATLPQADRYPYTFELVNDSSVNAFALPGGPTFVHTALITAAENEAQLVGVMAHEIAHVALRHGTNQASKANLIQLPAMIGGMVGQMKGGWIAQLSQLGIGLGANSVLLKFSRNAERDADLLGARMMHSIGYNPVEMARFFEILEKEGGARGPAFFSDHPNPGDRVKSIEEEIRLLPQRAYDGDSGQFSRMQGLVKQLPAPPKRGRQQGGGQAPGPAPAEPPRIQVSQQFKELRGKTVALSYPDNWQVFSSQQSGGATIAPPEGIHGGAQGQAVIGFGLIAGFTKGRSGDLTRDTEEFLQALAQRNQGMKLAKQSREVQLDGNRALLTVLTSPSPYGNILEIDTVVTVSRSEGLFHVIFISPQPESQKMGPVFRQILQSVRFAK